LVVAVHDGWGQASVLGLVVVKGQRDLPQVSVGASRGFAATLDQSVSAER
jgi:hypothetical protein